MSDEMENRTTPEPENIPEPETTPEPETGSAFAEPPQPYAWQPGGPDRPEPKVYSGERWHFHLSFWPTIATVAISGTLVPALLYNSSLSMVGALGSVVGLFPLMLLVAAVVLRIVLEKKNHYLAKGFLWGAVVCIALPAIVMVLAFGSCLLMLM